MRDATLVFPIKSGSVLLGRKKRGFGAGKWNGFGGKIGSESIEEAAIRELNEECGLKADQEDLSAAGVLEFRFLDRAEWNMRVHLFRLTRYFGRERTSEEMEPHWFTFDAIPYGDMWEDDQHWLPAVLEERTVHGSFVFKNERIVKISLDISESTIRDTEK